MPTRWSLREFAAIARYAAKWTALATPVAAIIGSACALFLWSLEWATQLKWAHPELLWALPVAGVALTGVPEVIIDGVTGLLVPPGDQRGLRAAVDRLLADEALRARMGRVAQERCRQRHGIDRIAAAYRTLYDDVVGATWLAS